ncbi:MAG: hypothetical protein Q3966_02210 [Neisseria sp.]|nr:hypothetical protein [Neisseria sp.]
MHSKKLPIMFLSVLLLAGCGGKEEKEAIPAASAPSAAVEKTATEADTPASSAGSDSPVESGSGEPMPEDLLRQFAWHGRQVAAKLAKSTPKQADGLYDEYSAMLDVYNEDKPSESGILVRINDREKDVLDDYLSDKYWTDGGKPTALLKKRMKALADVQLEYWDMGEGIAVVRPVADYYLRLFGKYVTPDYRRYLELDAQQAKDADTADGGLAFGWQKLADRMAAWEDFLQHYPDSNLAPKARDKYLEYQAWFFLGLDNSPTYSEDGGTLIGMGNGENDKIYGREYLQARQDYAKKHPGSHTAKLLALTEGLNREQAKEAVIAYQQKHFGKTSLVSDQTPQGQ